MSTIIYLEVENDPVELIEREQAAYEAQHSRLLETYAGQYIAMWQGQVVDHDADRTALGRRVRACYGDEPILITPVHLCWVKIGGSYFRVTLPSRHRRL